jgi:hypothetical protein
MRSATILICILFIFQSQEVFSQSNGFQYLLMKQDSSDVTKRMDIKVGLGSSITNHPKNHDYEGTDYLHGLSLEFNYRTTDFRLFKIKSSYQEGLSFFQNFPQRIGDVNLMSGLIKKQSPKLWIEFSYGIGLVAGSKRTGFISSSSSSEQEFQLKGETIGFNLITLPRTEFTRKNFIYGGIPLALKLHGKWLGLGIEGNINPYLPFVRGSIYFIISSKN